MNVTYKVIVVNYPITSMKQSSGVVVRSSNEFLVKQYVSQVSSGKHPLTIGSVAMVSNDCEIAYDSDVTTLKLYQSGENGEYSLICSELELERFRECVLDWLIPLRPSHELIELFNAVYKPNRRKNHPLSVDVANVCAEIGKHLATNNIDFVKLATTGDPWPLRVTKLPGGWSLS